VAVLCRRVAAEELAGAGQEQRWRVASGSWADQGKKAARRHTTGRCGAEQRAGGGFAGTGSGGCLRRRGGLGEKEKWGYDPCGRATRWGLVRGP
jgi:hypothetical protein